MMNPTFSRRADIRKMQSDVKFGRQLPFEIPFLSPCNFLPLFFAERAEVRCNAEGGCDTCQVSAVMKLEEARGEARPSSS